MKSHAVALMIVLLSACAQPSFVTDAQPVPATSETPDHFELPARFAVARTVYGRPQAPGPREAAIWEDLASRAKGFGTFAPLIKNERSLRSPDRNRLVEAAREQRYDYLLLVRMYPAHGSAEIVLFHTGSGGVMATAQAVSPDGGQRGFWGGQIRNPRRLDRATSRISKAAAPVVDDLLAGVAERQHK